MSVFAHEQIRQSVERVFKARFRFFVIKLRITKNFKCPMHRESEKGSVSISHKSTVYKRIGNNTERLFKDKQVSVLLRSLTIKK